jgi:hypothetical protein
MIHDPYITDEDREYMERVKPRGGEGSIGLEIIDEDEPRDRHSCAALRRKLMRHKGRTIYMCPPAT